MSEYTPEHEAPEAPAPVVSSNVYDKMKSFVLVVAPAIITFYLFAGHAYNWPNVEVNAGVAGAALVMLGVVVSWLSANFKKLPVEYDGTLHVTPQPDGPTQAVMVLKNYMDPAAVVSQDEVRFKVSHTPPPE